MLILDRGDLGKEIASDGGRNAPTGPACAATACGETGDTRGVNEFLANGGGGRSRDVAGTVLHVRERQ